MPLMPFHYDFWIAEHLAALWGRFPAADAFVAQGVGNGVLGGVWYAVALFVFWIHGTQPGQERLRRRILTIALGTVTAAALTVLAMSAITWAPPSAHPEVAGLYPDDFPINLNPNSFPSQSTALYVSIAGGIYSLSRTAGMWAWAGVLVLVALPRMYVGGHYLTDVVAGLAAGAAGYVCALQLETRVTARWERLFAGERGYVRYSLEAVVFLWLLQVATEFGHVSWIAQGLVGLGA